MLYRQYHPPLPLATFVQCLWYSEGFEGTHQRERLLPNGESGIVFDLRESTLPIYSPDDIANAQSFSPAIYCGARTDCFVIDTSQQERVIGIQFKPGGALPFLGMPAYEVAHATFALDELWSNQASLLREQLLAVKEISSMFRLLEIELLARHARWICKRNGFIHPAVNLAVRQLTRPSPTMRIADLASRTGLSARRFIEVFEQQTGLTPKAFHRVRRFQSVLTALRSQPVPQSRSMSNWAGLALECGYYDQAHFTRDFRNFSGMTPGQYIQVVTPHLNHLPIA